MAKPILDGVGKQALEQGPVPSPGPACHVHSELAVQSFLSPYHSRYAGRLTGTTTEALGLLEELMNMGPGT